MGAKRTLFFNAPNFSRRLAARASSRTAEQLGRSSQRLLGCSRVLDQKVCEGLCDLQGQGCYCLCLQGLHLGSRNVRKETSFRNQMGANLWRRALEVPADTGLFPNKTAHQGQRSQSSHNRPCAKSPNLQVRAAVRDWSERFFSFLVC